MHILVVKHGALGDVVRTSYFAAALRRKYKHDLRLSWITATESLPLIRFNPSIDDIWTDFSACKNIRFDHVFSLDDEIDAIENVMKLDAKIITGAVINSAGTRDYTEDSAEWFDMGLLSRFGRERSDRLKRSNIRSHAEIFSDIFNVEKPNPEFWGAKSHAKEIVSIRGNAVLLIGINPYAGHRWPSKGLPQEELKRLIQGLLDKELQGGQNKKIVLFGCGADRLHNLEVMRSINDPRVVAADTDNSVLRMAAIIGELDYLISSDTLALHLGIAQHISFAAFFAPTSAAEIDDFGLGTKILSTSIDYCSYAKEADNRTLTADRIYWAMTRHRPDLFEIDEVQGTLLKIVS